VRFRLNLGFCYAVLVVLLLSMGTWWSYFLVQEGHTHEEIQRQRLVNQKLHAIFLLENNTGINSDELDRLRTSYPFLQIAQTDSGFVVEITPETLAEVRSEAGHRRTMFLSEGIFFLALLVAGATILFLAYRREREFKQARELFLAGATHEFKTPLASLRLYTETLSRPDLDEQDAIRIRQRMLEDIRKTEKLVDQILVLGGEEDLANNPQQPLDLAQKCHAVLDDLAGLLHDHDVGLITDLPTDRLVFGRSLALTLAVRNLLQNAVQYSGTPAKISLTLTSKNNIHRLAVADQGPGIPAHLHGRIFDCFFSTRPTNQGAESGAGLGLYLVKRMAASLGGRVELTSNPGDGTTFTLVLPAYKGT